MRCRALWAPLVVVSLVAGTLTHVSPARALVTFTLGCPQEGYTMQISEGPANWRVADNCTWWTRITGLRGTVVLDIQVERHPSWSDDRAAASIKADLRKRGTDQAPDFHYNIIRYDQLNGAHFAVGGGVFARADGSTYGFLERETFSKGRMIKLTAVLKTPVNEFAFYNVGIANQVWATFRLL